MVLLVMVLPCLCSGISGCVEEWQNHFLAESFQFEQTALREPRQRYAGAGRSMHYFFSIPDRLRPRQLCGTVPRICHPSWIIHLLLFALLREYASKNKAAATEESQSRRIKITIMIKSERFSFRYSLFFTEPRVRRPVPLRLQIVARAKSYSGVRASP
jgi:hypothetical protein